MAAVETLLKIMLALAVVVFIAYPLLKQQLEDEEEPLELSEEAEGLYRRKESTYSALKELEFDFKTGKLSQADFEELDAKYRAEAIEILEAIELYESGEDRARGGRGKQVERTTGPAPPARQSRSGRTARPAAVPAAQAVAVVDPDVCACGFTNVEGARFCAACGQSLEPGADPPEPDEDRLVCPACGAELGSQHRFCAVCGAEAQA